MRIVITGAAGFIGRKLAERLARDGTLNGAAIDELALFDVVEPPLPEAGCKVSRTTGDIADPATVEALIGGDTGSVFHLAAVVSGQAEAEFETGMRINLLGTQNVVEACRKLTGTPKLIFSSSVAVFGGDTPPVIRDDSQPVPQTSYGTQKAIGELLVNDYSRKGFLDGRTLRLPTVVVRPGKPNRAASTWASSIIREPLQGERAVCPVAKEVEMWIASPRSVVASLLHAHGLPVAAFGANRIVSLPGLTVSVREMVEALRAVAGEAVVRRIDWHKDEAITRIVAGWKARFAPERALALGFPQDRSMREIVEAFVADDLAQPVA
jgi:nucleoside-diphosphate-sugar epimerase